MDADGIWNCLLKTPEKAKKTEKEKLTYVN